MSQCDPTKIGQFFAYEGAFRDLDPEDAAIIGERVEMIVGDAKVIADASGVRAEKDGMPMHLLSDDHVMLSRDAEEAVLFEMIGETDAYVEWACETASIAADVEDDDTPSYANF